MIVLKSPPFYLTDDVSRTRREGFVYEQTSLVITGFKPTDDGLSRVSHFQMDLFIDFISDIIEALLDENDLIYII